jgi:spermidine synthase
VQNIPLYKKLLSLFFPVLIKRTNSNINPVIEIFLYRKQWQLATSDALYSDGDRYRPLLTAFKELKQDLVSLHHVLVLGAGLGSAVSIMKSMGLYPSFTIVDVDKVILQLALEFSEASAAQKIEPVCADALEFIKNNKKAYNLIVIDVFLGRVVPGFISSIEFLELCKKCLQPPGRLVLNYIINDEMEWDTMKKNFVQVFPNCKVIKLDVNRILIA